jgi:hypothetical protein
MASKSDEPRPNDPQETVLERVQELTWSLLDGDISDDEVSLLDTLLLTGEEARNLYVDCVRLHTDLMIYHAKPEKAGTAGGSNSSVLSFLGADSPTTNLPSPRNAN